MKYGKKAGLFACALLISFTATAQELTNKGLFDKYDLNGDGYNDVDEYLKAAGDGFDEWDLNKDGFLTAGEYAEAITPGGAATRLVDAGGKMVAECDSNRDGKCSREEVVHQNREKLFPMMDVDGDGRLSAEEAMRFRGGTQPAGG
jgi:Ca2+-binding EF-hand superfamily protein